MIAIKYSFHFRYERHLPREVVIPAEKLSGLDLLDEDLKWKIRDIVDEDYNLLHSLLGDDLSDYEAKMAESHVWEKDLQRYSEQAVLIVQPDAE